LITAETVRSRCAALFEHAPWVAARAAEHAPFADAHALHAACMAVVRQASEDEQLGLIRAHPELGVSSVPLSEASDAEQTGAGLKRLTDDEFKRFAALNAAYRETFGFPFIICVRLHSKAEIFAAFATRLQNDAAAERAQALAEIGEITRLRLADLLGDERWPA
jgi:2-oxo-4-hydroxy-4-carboxy-5-ureidoimidazoline decarboxylase